MIVDAVYTWVDGTDPAWQESRRITREKHGLPDDSAEPGFQDRYISHGELQLSIARLRHFAPWIRRVFVVTMNQIPPNIADIIIIDHKDILPPEALPTFSSLAIETVLHRIPNLAEHFIYFNDDMFLGKPVTIGDFFEVQNNKIYTVLPWLYNRPIQHCEINTYQSALYTTAAVVERHYGKATAVHACRNPSHTALPKTKQSYIRAWQLCNAELKSTQLSPFRQMKQLIHFVTNFLDIAGGYAVLAIGDARYFATDQLYYEHYIAAGSAPKMFCINQVRSDRFEAIMQETVYTKVKPPTVSKIRRRRF
jgi:hypothetical protein